MMRTLPVWLESRRHVVAQPTRLRGDRSQPAGPGNHAASARLRRSIPSLAALLACLLPLAVPAAGTTSETATRLRAITLHPVMAGDEPVTLWSRDDAGALPLVLSHDMESHDMQPASGGFTPEGATLQLDATGAADYRVQVQFETAMWVGDTENIKVGLAGCRSGWIDATPSGAGSYLLPAATPAQQSCFPAYPRARIERAIRSQAGPDQQQFVDWAIDLWRQDAHAAWTAIDRVRIRIDARTGNGWQPLTTVEVRILAGC